MQRPRLCVLAAALASSTANLFLNGVRIADLSAPLALVAGANTITGTGAGALGAISDSKYRYYRVTLKGTNGDTAGWVQVGEWGFFSAGNRVFADAVTDGTNLYNADANIAKANDNNNATRWIGTINSAATAYASTINKTADGATSAIFDFTSARKLDVCRYMQQTTSTLNRCPTAFTIEGSNDKDVWVTLNNTNSFTVPTSAGAWSNDITLTYPPSSLTINLNSATDTLTLNSASTYTGGTTIQQGIIKPTNAAALGSGAIAQSGGTLDISVLTTAEQTAIIGRYTRTGGKLITTVGGMLYLNDVLITDKTAAIVLPAGNNTVSGTGGALSGVISGGGLTVNLWSAANTLTLSAANTYTGGTTLQKGIVSMQNANALGTTGAVSLAADSVLDGTGGATGSFINGDGQIFGRIANGSQLGTIILGNQTAGSVNWQGKITVNGTGSTSQCWTGKAGSGGCTVTFNSNFDTWWIGKDGSATDPMSIIVSAGCTVTTSPSQGAGSLYFNNVSGAGSLAMRGNAGNHYILGQATIANLNINRPTTLSSNDSYNSNSLINGGGSLTFSGTGVTTLSGANTYSGGTWINTGSTAKAGNVNAFGTGAMTVQAGGTLNKGGFALANAITNSGGTVIA